MAYYVGYFSHGSTTPSEPVPQHCEVSKWHSFWHTRLVGLLWTGDRPVGDASTWQHKTFRTDIHASGGTRTRNPSKRTAKDKRV